MHSIDHDTQLYLGNVMLDQVRGIQEYLITNESTLYAVPPGEIPLVIRYSGICQRGLVSVKFTDTIAKVRTKVRGFISEITSSHQFLLDGAQLSDTKTISECKIAANSELCVVGAGDIPVYIKTIKVYRVPYRYQADRYNSDPQSEDQ